MKLKAGSTVAKGVMLVKARLNEAEPAQSSSARQMSPVMSWTISFFSLPPKD